MKRLLLYLVLAAVVFLSACTAAPQDVQEGSTAAAGAEQTSLMTAQSTETECNTGGLVPQEENRMTNPDIQPAKESTAAQTKAGEKRLAFNVGFQTNTHGYVDGEKASAVLLRTRAELDAFYRNDPDNNKEAYKAELAPYGDSFFKTHALLMLMQPEPSGSIALEVQGVSLRSGKLCVQGERNAPDPRTADMARWVIGIELKQADLPEGNAAASAVFITSIDESKSNA